MKYSASPLIGILVIVGFSPIVEALTLEDYHSVSGVLAWETTVPPDLLEGERWELTWRISRAHGGKSESVDTGIVFPGEQANRRIQIFVWERDRVVDDQGGEKMKAVFRVMNEKGRWSDTPTWLPVPSGYSNLHSFMKCGEVTDDGWLMMLQPSDSKDACFLEFVYRSAP